MDYEKKYKEALERAKTIYQGSYKPDVAATIAEILQNIFPELKESEDEKIKNEIIKFLELPHPQFVGKRHQEEWIAWLKKQGKEKPKWTEEDEKNFRDIIGAIHAVAYQTTEDEESRLEWLYTIKQRIGG